MLNKMLKKKFLISFTAIFVLFVICLLSKTPKEFKQELSYVPDDVAVSNIYLLDGYQFVSLTNVALKEEETTEKAREIIEILIQDGPGENKIPSGFKSLINSEVVLNKVRFKDGILEVDFSKNLFETKEEYEIKILEALIYSLTSIKGVKGVQINLDGKLLEELPLSKLKLPKVLDKTFGINKDYNVSSLDNVSKVTIYYLNKYNDNYYYVPVTRYMNNVSEKVSVIIDELRDNNFYLTGLMSFMNSDVNLLDSSIENDEITLNFSRSIYNDEDSKQVFQEVIDSINLSIEATYGIDAISYVVEDEPLNFN